MNSKFFRLALIALFLNIVLNIVSTVSADTVHQPSTVVELYTSQGCSSCPPADVFLGDLAKNRNILALSFNVTYWDYIGWKDTLARKEFDGRQVYYRDQLNARYVYTPQMVIAGRTHEVGSDRLAVQKAIDANEGHAQSVKLNWSIDKSNLNVHLPEGEGDAVIWLFHMDAKHDVPVRRGENSGENLSYYNVVRKIERMADWDGKAKTLTLDLAMIRDLGRDGCALVVQKKGYGEIVAALQISLNP